MFKKFLSFPFLFLMFFVNFSSVNAASLPGSYNGSDISVSPHAEFYNSSRTYITTSTNQPTSDSSPYYSASLASSDGYLSLGLNHTLATDTLYTITLYIGNGSDAAIGVIDRTLGTGSYGKQANSNASNGTCQAHIYSWVDTWNGDYSITTGNGNMPTGMYFITFKVTCDNGTFINIPFHFDRTVSMVMYYGYSLEILGRTDGLTEEDIQNIINTSGLATASSVSEVQSSVNQVQEEVENIDDSINNTDTSSSESQAGAFFEGFESNDYGLSDIITMPLDLIKGLTSNSCVALSLTVPFVNKTFELPCMSSIYSQYFGSFFTIYQTITFGFVAYWVVVKIFALVKSFKDPNDDKIEVVDL